MTARLSWIQQNAWLAGSDLETERLQAEQEGRELGPLTAKFKKLLAVAPEARDEAWHEAAGRLVDRVQEQPCRGQEPSDLEGIRAARPRRVTLRPWRGDRSEFIRRLHGGWLGRICGCLLGKPVEGWNRGSIRITAEATGNWPLTNYLRRPTEAEQKEIEKSTPRNKINPHWPPADWLRDNVRGMVEDDDTNYTVTGFAIVKRFGADFTPLNVAQFWCDNIPIFHTCTAERVAYRNLVQCVVPPASAVVRNPYREWIGAQIRADYFGYANPGDPARSAEWAWRDAGISHVKNGIYGEMWVAAMLAAAYVETDWVKIIRAGLAEIPARSRLSADIETVLAARAAGRSYEQVVDQIHAQWQELRAHDWCHTNSNAQVVTVGLLWGEDDYEKTITRSVMPGFDTDCNGATCGSLWGIKHGLDALPRKWTRPIRDRIRTSVAGYHEASISQLAEEMVDVALKAAPARRKWCSVGLDTSSLK